MTKKFWISVAVGTGFLFLSFFSNIGSADVSAPMMPDVANRFQILEDRIQALEKELDEQGKKHDEEMGALRRELEIKAPQAGFAEIPKPSEGGPKWLEGLAMGGDLRLRYEGIDRNEATRDLNRFRYRLRWKITKELTEDLDLGFRIVSGSATDPTSTNQTLTGDFTYKSIFLDQVYAKYEPSFLKDHVSFLKEAEVAGGKFENPFFANSSGLVWDADLMPEGFYESLQFVFLDGRVEPFVNVGEFLLQENATGADAELYGVQTGLHWEALKLAEDSPVRVTNAFAYYDFSDYARDSNFIVSGTSLARGNTRFGSSTELAAGDFDILQVYNAIEFKVANLPVKLFGDFATNLADRATDPLGRDVGYEYGLRLGGTKEKGDWEATYYYAYVEANAVVGAFSDSDFGTGHADKRGSAFQLKYKLTDYLKLGFTSYFVNNVTGSDDETRRFQTDLEWVF